MRLLLNKDEKTQNMEVVFDEIHWSVGCSVHMVVKREEGSRRSRPGHALGLNLEREKTTLCAEMGSQVLLSLCFTVCYCWLPDNLLYPYSTLIAWLIVCESVI